MYKFVTSPLPGYSYFGVYHNVFIFTIADLHFLANKVLIFRAKKDLPTKQSDYP